MKLPFFLASRFVAAETLEETLAVVRDLNQKGLHVALDRLGEYVDDREVAAEARDTYIDLVRRIARERRSDQLQHTNVSIKLSMMGQKIDEDFCLANLRQLMDVAKEKDVFVRLDMEGGDITESTLSLFEAVYPDYSDHIGAVLQAYLKRTERDVERMCELNASVRICKGAYKEPPEIAYQSMDTIRARFIDYMKELIRHARNPGIATHDDLIINATKDFVRQEDVGYDRFEFQMLYGIRPETQQAIAAEGYNMLVYVPYGTEWLPYYTRRLSERKENVWFVVKNLVRQ